jgi:hypothetical protein
MAKMSILKKETMMAKPLSDAKSTVSKRRYMIMLTLPDTRSTGRIYMHIRENFCLAVSMVILVVSQSY